MPEVKKEKKPEKEINIDAKHPHHRFAMGIAVGIALGIFLIVLALGIYVYLFKAMWDAPNGAVLREREVNDNEEVADENLNGAEENINEVAENVNAEEETTNINEGSANVSEGGEISEIQLGSIEMNLEDIKTIQESVDNGHQPWRLDPLMVASADGVQYGFSIEDSYKLISRVDIGEYSGTGEAEIEVIHGDKTYIVQLIQPVTVGEDGIWAINSIREKE